MNSSKVITVLYDMENISPELHYLCQFFSTIFDAQFELCKIEDHTIDSELSISYCQNQELSYSSQKPLIEIPPDGNFWSNYLDKKNMQLELKNRFYFNNFKAEKFYHTTSLIGNKIVLVDDLFALIFILITRYEELLLNAKVLDKHGRFLADKSITADFIEKPLVNLYLKAFKGLIEQVYSISLNMRYHGLTVVMSHDIDIPFYFSRGRSELSELKHFLLHRNGKYKSWLDLWQYVKFLVGAESDPYDTFEYMCNVEKEYGVKSTYFILLSEENRWGLDLKRYSQRLNMLIEAGHEIALHPGYTALANVPAIEEQRDALEQLVGQKIHGVRHHFLRFQVPESYHAISCCGLAYDSSIGYAEKHGFRAGICTPFKPYDIQLRIPIDLWEIPLIVMDGTLKDYEGFSPEEALVKIESIAAAIHNVGGVLVINWHNSFFFQGGPEWCRVYEESLRFFNQLNARFSTCSNLIKNAACRLSKNQNKYNSKIVV